MGNEITTETDRLLVEEAHARIAQIAQDFRPSVWRLEEGFLRLSYALLEAYDRAKAVRDTLSATSLEWWRTAHEDEPILSSDDPFVPYCRSLLPDMPPELFQRIRVVVRAMRVRWATADEAVAAGVRLDRAKTRELCRVPDRVVPILAREETYHGLTFDVLPARTPDPSKPSLRALVGSIIECRRQQVHETGRQEKLAETLAQNDLDPMAGADEILSVLKAGKPLEVPADTSSVVRFWTTVGTLMGEFARQQKSLCDELFSGRPLSQDARDARAAMVAGLRRVLSVLERE
jgi:hypothetical protein